MKVAVFGLGYVGTVSAAFFAGAGHAVVGIDPNEQKVTLVNSGRSPVFEPGVDELLREALADGRLRASTQPDDGVEDCDIVFVCVGTPSRSSGHIDTSALETVMLQIGKALRNSSSYTSIVIRSTVLPDMVTNSLIPALAEARGELPGEHYGFALNPEFLREGRALKDFVNAPFIIIGEYDTRSAEALISIYNSVRGEIIRLGLADAAMVKYASNSFHALKVAFANEIGLVCKQMGADGHKVMDIFCRDGELNISPRYLKPGFAFGGSCLPKDLRALTYYANKTDVPVPLLNSILVSNRRYLEQCIDMVLGIGRKRIGLFGLSFKAGTDDLRESPMVTLAETLIGKGLEVKVFDTCVSLAQLTGTNRDYIDQHIPHIARLLKPSIDEVVAESDILVIGNASPEFALVAKLAKPDQVVIDFAHMIDTPSLSS